MSDNKRINRVCVLKRELSISLTLSKLWGEIKEGVVNRDEALEAIIEILDSDVNLQYAYTNRRGSY
jgi:predicted PP-loop superfamily ATPase